MENIADDFGAIRKRLAEIEKTPVKPTFQQELAGKIFDAKIDVVNIAVGSIRMAPVTETTLTDPLPSPSFVVTRPGTTSMTSRTVFYIQFDPDRSGVSYAEASQIREAVEMRGSHYLVKPFRYSGDSWLSGDVPGRRRVKYVIDLMEAYADNIQHPLNLQLCELSDVDMHLTTCPAVSIQVTL